MSAFNMTAFPEIFGDLLGLDLEPMGVLLTIAIVVSVTLTLSILSLDFTGIAVADICIIAFCTYLDWFPIWVTILIALFVAALVGKKTVSIFGGGI